MTIYRGVGGGGNATSDSEINEVTALSVEAEDSATLAGVSANAASVSAGSAATSASAASSSASAASASAATATTQATNASTSAAGGATSASNAAASEAAALASENASAASEAAASTAATTATTQASGAVVSASTATTQATNATSSASAASTSETNAATSETNAASSASAASSSASSASASADAALTALDSFDDRYLGQKTSNPTVDNDGNALIAGALYFNTTDSVMKVYEGSVWVAAYASLSGALLQVNNLTDLANIVSARNNLGLGTVATTDAAAYATAAQGALADSAFQSADAFGDRGTGVNSTYVSSVAVGGTTFAQPAVTGEINSDEGYFGISFAGATNVTVDDLTVNSTYVYIDNTGALQQQVTEPTRQDFSRKVFTMRIAVDTNTNLISSFEYLNNPIGRYSNSIRDLYTFLLANGVPFKRNQTITGRSADLGFDIGSGTLMEFGGTGDINNANILSFDAVANVEFFLATRTNTDSGGNVNLPKTWDNAGTLTALGSTTVVGHRLYRFSDGTFVMQYGQGNYANITLARTGAVLENYILNPALENATFFGWWFIQSTATNTSGTTLTDFKEYTIGIQGASSSALAGCLLKGNNLSDLLDASDARTNLGLGTAATTASTDYATAAQGALADSATQPADLATIATTGNYADLTGTVPTWNQNTTGNAATATNAAGAFNVPGILTVAGDRSFFNANNEVYALGVRYAASTAVMYIGATNSATPSMQFSSSGGGSLATLDSSGNFTATGNVTAYSDERLKKDWEEIQPDFVSQLANVKSGTYTRTDSDERQAGVSAQSLQELLPETVIAGVDGLLSVAYGNAAMVAVVELAKEIRMLKEELKALKGV